MTVRKLVMDVNPKILDNSIRFPVMRSKYCSNLACFSQQQIYKEKFTRARQTGGLFSKVAVHGSKWLILSRMGGETNRHQSCYLSFTGAIPSFQH